MRAYGHKRVALCSCCHSHYAESAGDRGRARREQKEAIVENAVANGCRCLPNGASSGGGWCDEHDLYGDDDYEVSSHCDEDPNCPDCHWKRLLEEFDMRQRGLVDDDE